MRHGAIARPEAQRALDAFVDDVRTGPHVLVIEGDAGIGKTTVWIQGCDTAQRGGLTVLTARVGQAESVMSYAALADLLGAVDHAVIDALPELQRLAVRRVLLMADDGGPATDQRIVGAACVAVLEALAADAPVLIAIDDVQWLDSASQAVIAFAARRITGRIGLLVSERCEPGNGTAPTWLQVNTPGRVRQLTVTPMTLGQLQLLVSTELGHSLPRPTMVRIHEVAAGNPLYALELARHVPFSDRLPGSLAELVRLRIASISPETRDVLLTAAAAGAPTVELLAAAHDTGVEQVVEALKPAEDKNVITLDGHRVHFTHPLLSRGIYTGAVAARRRAAHRALAPHEPQLEVHARHLALASVSADKTTLAALDQAADSARTAGAPSTAAELLEFAIRLGGDTPLRRLRAAGDYFQAGDTANTRALLEPLHRELSGPLRAIALNLLAAIHIYDNDFATARQLLTEAAEHAETAPPLLVQTLISLAYVEFTDGAAPADSYGLALEHARKAMELALMMPGRSLAGRALAMWVHTNFAYGNGVDQANLQRALEREGRHDDVALPFSPSGVRALILAWTGELAEAREQMRQVHRRYRERGDDRNTMGVTAYQALIELWNGQFGAATSFADEAVQQADQLGGGHIAIIPLSVRATVNAFAGREQSARDDITVALELADQCGAPRMAEWPNMCLGFLELSLGNPAAAVAALEPQWTRLAELPGFEIMHCWFLPDAVEAMIAIGRHDDAVPLIEALEERGTRLDRAWMLAAGARSRALWLSAQGEVQAALEAVQQAITHHHRVAMPFEQARTELLLGQLQRRTRSKGEASATLLTALTTFEQLGSPLWVDRARAELARTNVTGAGNPLLTPTEQRVAELAVQGMTNRDIGSALFISPKTVEANMTRIYRKLQIRSRAELGRKMARLDT